MDRLMEWYRIQFLLWQCHWRTLLLTAKRWTWKVQHPPAWQNLIGLRVTHIHENRGERGIPPEKNFMTPSQNLQVPPRKFLASLCSKICNFFQFFLKKLKNSENFSSKKVELPDWSETCRNALKSDKNFGVGGTSPPKILPDLGGPPGFRSYFMYGT